MNNQKNIVSEIFTDKTDTKKKVNRSELVVPSKIISLIDGGITSEVLNELALKYPIYSYRTQVTIHGKFDNIGLYSYGYKHLTVNKNQSLGVRWGAIDESKRQTIKESIKFAGYGYTKNSTECYFFKSKRANKENLEATLNELKMLKNKIDTTLLESGSTQIYYMNIFGVYECYLIIHVNAILETNVQKFINGIISPSEVESKKQELIKEREASDLKYKLEREASIKEREANYNKVDFTKLDVYPKVSKTSEVGTFITISHSYLDNSCIFEVKHVYLVKGKKIPRFNKKEYKTLDEALIAANEPKEGWNDSIYKGLTSGWQIK